ncbi:Lipoyltransferase 1-like protein [Leptotrombidium deliense]|uniref:Lipoyltransferase 1-like protein n=1 Tax=Leptotrombidium deliense TaxID=299467 RepID=A0A443RXH1_9ACAR|nr:Lipoyltransferase 1-like protein [Leptotrombidium deliense]
MCKHFMKNKLLSLPVLWRSFNRNLHHFNHQSLNNQNGTVIISLSNDIYSNLALEEWLFKRIRFDSNQCLLLMWTNDKTIVFGRHQNPWDECHLNACVANNVNICRRQSGGGTVFHDNNNLNISFFTNKKHYNRRSNLTFLKEVLGECYNIDCDISDREDLILSDGGFKISGTASKLAAINAYHHCTLLVDVDLNLMRKVIRKHRLNIDSNATKSVPSAVKNLSSISREICIQSLTQQ